MDYFPEHPEHFFVSVEEARRHSAKCIKVTAHYRGSSSSDSSE